MKPVSINSQTRLTGLELLAMSSNDNAIIPTNVIPIKKLIVNPYTVLSNKLYTSKYSHHWLYCDTVIKASSIYYILDAILN